MERTVSKAPKFNLDEINQMHNITETSKQVVFRVSVQIKDFTPPRNVQSQTMPTVMITLSIKGKSQGLKTNSCRVKQTRNKRTEAPSIFDMKKNIVSVRQEEKPKRTYKYS